MTNGLLRALEFHHQRLDGGSVAVEQHLAFHRRQNLRQADLELVLEIRQHQDRKDQKDQALADERRDDHEHRHRGMVPAVVGAITGVRHGFRGPLQALHERARVALEMVHPKHVERAQDEHGQGQQRQQREQPAGRAPCLVLHAELLVDSGKLRYFRREVRHTPEGPGQQRQFRVRAGPRSRGPAGSRPSCHAGNPAACAPGRCSP